MVSFLPFSALTPPTHRAHEVAAPPYDVVSREEAAALIEGRPDSLMRVTRVDASTRVTLMRLSGRPSIKAAASSRLTTS